MNKISKKSIPLIVMLIAAIWFIPVQAQPCMMGCNDNTFLNTSDPNTIEYDNFVSGYHQSIIKREDGSFYVWGEGASPYDTDFNSSHLYEATLIDPTNGFNFTGEPLKATIGSYGQSIMEFALLTTEGLYLWGNGNISANSIRLVHESVRSSNSFQKITSASITNANTYGLPVGVNPTDVKMMYGSYGTLAITTCSGQAWVLSATGNKNGDGTTDGPGQYNRWHRVSTEPGIPLENVVALRGTSNALMALTVDGRIYTWGTNVYLGNNTNKQNILYATQMTLPVGVTPKMIGMTLTNLGGGFNTYFILSTQGELYSLGYNSRGQMGIYATSTERWNWERVKSDETTEMSNISWFSPNEHDPTFPIVTALTSEGKLYGWGENTYNVLGEGSGRTHPKLMFGDLDPNDKILAVETGGHTISIYKECETSLGYIGHEIYGSYANNSGENTHTTFQFGDAQFNDDLCGINFAPPLPEVQNLEICPNENADLNDALLNSPNPGFTIEWWTTPDRQAGTQVANPNFVGVGTYYVFFIPESPSPCYTVPDDGEQVVVSEKDPNSTDYDCILSCLPTGDCNENAFLFTSDPNTLEYDNLISGFHSTIAKQQDGNYLIWGQGAKPNTFGEHLYEPTLITPENGFNYTGSILKATLGTAGYSTDGTDQFAILTTDGLYIWGGGGDIILDVMVHRSVKGTTTFDKMTDTNIPNANEYGLPQGVNPEDVKMLFGSYATLGIVTCTGEAYVISHRGNKNGDGSTDGASEYNKWHKVSVSEGVPLRKVVAMRGTPGAMMALTSDGKIYTWGTDTYLGDGTAKADRLYASEMTLPAGVVPKMIGMTKASNTAYTHRNNSYYLLSTTGEVYSLGDNSKKQLGTFDTDESTTWVNVKSTDASTNMTNIVWISPNEHDSAGHAAVTALTADGKLWGWGMNHTNMLGHGSHLDYYVDPRYMFGELDPNDKILAVETGGHINTIFKDCEYKLGYIGHNINGSYATSDNNDTYSPDFKFDGAKLTNLCAIYTPPYPEVIDLTSCPGSTFDLMDALQNTVPTGYNLEWWTTIDRTPGTEVANPEEAGPGTYYAFFISDEDECQLIEGEEVVLSYYEPTDEEYESCVCFRDPVFTGLGSETQVGISLIKGRETLQSSDNWPQSRKSGFIALESNKQGMVVTRIAKADLGNIVSPQEGMMVYDTTDKCLKIYSDDEWKCFATPACP